MKTVFWLMTVYPWGWNGPGDISVFLAEQGDSIQVCKQQALERLEDFIQDFKGTALIYRDSAMVSCSIGCKIKVEPTYLPVCDEVYRWTGEGIAWNPGDSKARNLFEWNRLKRAQKELEELMTEMKEYPHE